MVCRCCRYFCLYIKDFRKHFEPLLVMFQRYLLYSEIQCIAFPGNLSQHESLEIANDLKYMFASSNSEGVPLRPPQRTMKLPLGDLYYRLPVKNPMEENSVVELYFQIGKETTEKHVLTDLVDRVRVSTWRIANKTSRKSQCSQLYSSILCND